MRRIAQAWTSNEFELVIALMCMITGLPLAFGVAPSPQSIAAVLPVWARILWGVSLALGGLLVVVGILWRHYKPIQFIAGLYLERAGLHMVGTALVSFVIAVIAYAGAPSFFSSILFSAFVAACWSRSRRIGREILIIREHGQGSE